MPSNYLTSDPIQGQIDLDDKFITDAWLVDQFVGGNLFSSGYNYYGQLAIANGGSQVSSVTQIGSLVNWKFVDAGYNTSAAIKNDGTLWVWGTTNSQGATAQYSSPVQVGLLTNWSQVSTGSYSGLAVKTDGTLWGWDVSNQWGQLGNETRVSYSSPVQIGSLNNWKQVACGYRYTMAVKRDGTLWGWGYNVYGQLGNGTQNSYSSPIQIGSLTNWKSVTCGTLFSAGLKTDGTIWAWGYDGYSQGLFGNSSRGVMYTSPIQIGSSTNWKQISIKSYAGGLVYQHLAAIKTDGTLWTWGDNKYGELGNGTTIYYSSPIQVGSLTNWKWVTSYEYSTLAIKTDGTLWGWGEGSSGQLGNSANVKYSSPVQIGSLTNWKQVSLGKDYSLAITFKELG